MRSIRAWLLFGYGPRFAQSPGNMATSTSSSIAELQKAGVILRANEAVAIAQQLIDNPLGGASQIAPPYGPPSPGNIFVDDEGVVVCRACATTPAVSEIAVFLQTLLPDGTPHVPGALRYTIARALLEVDAPPFDSIQQLSDALTRFESGDRTAVVRGLVARAHSVWLDRMRAPSAVDRRRLMPSSTDFRRELRAADARYYDLVRADTQVRPYEDVGADRRVGPERKRASALVVGVAIGLGLIRIGEFMHTRSAPFHPTVSAAQSAPPRAALPDAASATVPAAVAVATTGAVVDAPANSIVRRSVRREASTPRAIATATKTASRPQPRGEQKRSSIMDRAPLRWLRNVVRIDPL
jgi:hypothetical protein